MTTNPTPYLIIRGAAAAIEYYTNVFEASVACRQQDADGRIRHAELRIGDGSIMLTDEAPEEFANWRGPEFYGGSPAHVYLYVADADQVFGRALAAGGRELLPLQDQPYGERSGGVIDPFGHVWYIATPLQTAATTLDCTVTGRKHDRFDTRRAPHTLTVDLRSAPPARSGNARHGMRRGQ